jgi:hypothetical protein
VVADLLTNYPLNMDFRRILSDNEWAAWIHLVQNLMFLHRNNEEDKFARKLTASGFFTIKSMYGDFMKYMVYLKEHLKAKGTTRN